MKPFTVNSDVWRVVRVDPDDPRLIDRTGWRKIATTDPHTSTIHISDEVHPPLLDRVMIHEAAHAVTISYHLLDQMREVLPERYWVYVEEWAVHLVEVYGLEASSLASQALGRPVCVRGFCHDRP